MFPLWHAINRLVPVKARSCHYQDQGESSRSRLQGKKGRFLKRTLGWDGSLLCFRLNMENTEERKEWGLLELLYWQQKVWGCSNSRGLCWLLVSFCCVVCTLLLHVQPTGQIDYVFAQRVMTIDQNQWAAPLCAMSLLPGIIRILPVGIFTKPTKSLMVLCTAPKTLSSSAVN